MTSSQPLASRRRFPPADALCEERWLVSAVGSAFRDGYDSLDIALHYGLPEPEVCRMITDERRRRLSLQKKDRWAQQGAASALTAF